MYEFPENFTSIHLESLINNLCTMINRDRTIEDTLIYELNYLLSHYETDE